MREKRKQLTGRHQSKPTEQKAQDAFVADICSSMDNAVRILNSKEKITLDRVSRPKKPRQLTASEIAEIRAERLNLSQSVFALLLNVSLKTVQAWEQSVNKPNGAALRLLNMLSKHPDAFRAIIFGDVYQR